MNGGAIKAILMGLESNTSKMPDPALVMRQPRRIVPAGSFIQDLETKLDARYGACILGRPGKSSF